MLSDLLKGYIYKQINIESINESVSSILFIEQVTGFFLKNGERGGK